MPAPTTPSPTGSAQQQPGSTMGSQAATSAGDVVDPRSVVVTVDCFILALLGLLILLRLPRALVRLSKFEWTRGHFLWYDPTPRHLPSYIDFNNSAALSTFGLRRLESTKGRGHTEAKETLEKTNHGATIQTVEHHVHAHAQHGIYDTYPPSKPKGNHPPNLPIIASPSTLVTLPPIPIQALAPPRHISSCPSLLRLFEQPLRSRFVPGYSWNQAIILALYSSCIAYPAFYRSNPFTDPIRAGWIAMSQLPFVFVLATKNNVLGTFLGLGYEKLNFAHRFAGRILVLAANVHGIGYFYKWTAAGNFKTAIRGPGNTWGLVALVCLDVLCLFSTSFWRKRFYSVFSLTHIVGITLGLVALWNHRETSVPFVATAIGLYILDHVLRLLKTHPCTATLRPLPGLQITQIEIPKLNTGWRAGQHIRIRVLSSGLGWFGWSEVHPFTIANASHSDVDINHDHTQTLGDGNGGDGMVLLCKKAGNWTSRLYDLAGAEGYFGASGTGKTVKVLVEGPYGGPGHAIFASYSAAIFITGGSGITFAMAAIQELIREGAKGRSNTKVVELVWVVQDPGSISPLLPTLSALVKQRAHTSIRLSIHYTRALTRKVSLTQEELPSRLSIKPGRPDMVKAIDLVISRRLEIQARRQGGAGRLNGLLVGVCGPASLGDAVVEAIGGLEPPRKNQIGGIELHEE
ncbi:hypothetical protein BDN72DRAFT_572361 [Pluteus cervinus]|uniref:Uncharacterized protein n=1 Tax=Pluteus cervinus TaxID=181527 RepID=A0ACD3AXD0_9AGAR|nr:hypothetical protein BDN72DRAFT_572361 [Pluteus cervinus]